MRIQAFFVISMCLAGAGAGWASPPEVEALPIPRDLTGPGGGQPVDGISLSDLVLIGLERNPRLAQAAIFIDKARGAALQAGLYPNPTFSTTYDELGDRTGPGGINSQVVSQEIVTAHKLRLNRNAANQITTQAAFQLAAERYSLLAGIRQNYFEVLTLQRRIEILDELVTLAEKSVDTTQQLLKAKQVARLDVVQLEVDLERFRAEREATARELPGAFRRLAAVVGAHDLPYMLVIGSLEAPLPKYDLGQAQEFLLREHPDIRTAQVGVERAQILLRRAQVEPIPNITVGAGYVRQNQNRSNDWVIGASIPVPVWNRNQGNIIAAQAQVAAALQQIGRVENDLVERLATAFRDYMAAVQRAQRYRSNILPRARETYDLSMNAFKGGQFEYLRVLEAQRSLAQANLEYVRAQGAAWTSASVISGLLLEEQWPGHTVDNAKP